MNTKKLILVDCNGVLLDYETGFREWMEQLGYHHVDLPKREYQFHHHFRDLTEDDATKLCDFYNRSEAVGHLLPFRNAEIFVPKLHEELGFKFRVLTSFGGDKWSQKRRDELLHEHFGNAIENVEFLDFGEPKEHVLARYRDTGFWWIEDLPKNADAGHALGLQSVLIEHYYNSYHICNYPVVTDWEQVYRVIKRAESGL